METKLQNSIKTFATEAGRFKLGDLASILGVDEEKIWNVLVNLISTGEIEGTFANNNSEFVTKVKLRQEILTILDNPSLLDSYRSQNRKDFVFSNLRRIKKCPKCKVVIKNEGKFCPNCGESLG
ncbi:MAG: hypothetical protein ACTSRG_02835 [Candidatus Helarchaeota archaeon]